MTENLASLCAVTIDLTVLGELPGLDQEIARTTVWAVHHDRFDEGRILNARRGCTMSEDQMYAVASIYRRIWQIDLGRNERSTCFLCGRTLPEAEERLCECFRGAHIDVYYHCTKESIRELQELKPTTWAQTIVETTQCPKCKRLNVIHASLPARRFEQKRKWETPRYCQDCNNSKPYRTDDRRSSVPPRKKNLRTPMMELSNMATLRDGGDYKLQ